MPTDPIPRDPVYMSYITRHHQEVRTTSPNRISPPPFRPATGLTYTDLQLQTSRAAYPHFHRPFNDHSRYLAVAGTADRAAYRDLPRLPPAPWDGSPNPDITGVPFVRRPFSAPSAARTTLTPDLQDLAGATLTDNMTTATGRPCYTYSALVEADVESGEPVVDSAKLEVERELGEWRLRRVQTYQVPPSSVGYGFGGARPFHQDYRHYKYFGFGGQGAKTSWAHNPKYSMMYGDLLASVSARDPAAPPLATQDIPVAPPLQPGGPGTARRRLTAAERALVRTHRQHNYGSEGVPSDPRVSRLLTQMAYGVRPTPRAATRHVRSYQQRDGSYEPYNSMIHGEIIEPYRLRVDLDRRKSLPSEAFLRATASANAAAAAAAAAATGSPYSAAGTSLRSNTYNAARVTTYRQMGSPYAGEYNRSPNHGSQSPWHQRYGHYKYSGFAGKGASSSWARNPKYAYMYD